MCSVRSLRRVILSAAASAVFALSAMAAEPDASAPPAGQCHGIDMLAELQARAPDVYQKIIDESSKLPNSDAVFWKIEKPGIEPSYLLGTMHLSDARLTELTPKIREAIQHSKLVALEVADLSDNAVAAAMGKAADLVVYKDGKNLEAQLTADEFKKVQALVAKSGMPGEFATLFRPWIVSMLMAMSDCERKSVASGAPVLDIKVAEEAQKNNIPVNGLETIEEQLAALAAVPDDQQIQMLKVGLKYADRADDMMETLVQMYLKRQIGAAMPFQIALAAENGTPASAFDGFRKTLLVDRNANMRKAAEKMLENGNAFIAVGALHLPGQTGLVALLRDSGYSLTPLE